MTVNKFIKELQALSPEKRELPLAIVAPNGLHFEPRIKVHYEKYDSVLSGNLPTKMIISY